MAKRARKKYAKLKEEENVVIPKPKSESKVIEKRYVHIHLADIAKALLIGLAIVALAYVLVEIGDIILIFFISLLFAAALDPTVDMLEEKFKFPRGVSVILIYIVLIGLLGVFISNFVPIIGNELLRLAVQVQSLVENVVNGEFNTPAALEWLNPIIEKNLSGIDSTALATQLEGQLLSIGETLTSLAGNAYKTFVAISNGIANAILVLLLTYFMTVDEHLIDKFLLQVFPSKYGEYITAKTKAVKDKIGQWLRGQIALMIAVGLVTYIGLLILGVEYAATLAMFAGITELVPVIGPLFGWVAAIPIAANESAMLVLWVTVLYFIIQRLENNILVPIIMKKATGLHPIVVLFAMLVGFRFMGIIGVVISVPVAASIGIFLGDYIVKER